MRFAWTNACIPPWWGVDACGSNTPPSTEGFCCKDLSQIHEDIQEISRGSELLGAFFPYLQDSPSHKQAFNVCPDGTRPFVLPSLLSVVALTSLLLCQPAQTSFFCLVSFEVVTVGCSYSASRAAVWLPNLMGVLAGTVLFLCVGSRATSRSRECPGFLHTFITSRMLIINRGIFRRDIVSQNQRTLKPYPST